MTLPVQTPIDRYTYTGATSFVYSFLILDDGDLAVTVDGVGKTLGVDYTVSGVGDLSGGSISYIGALTSGQVVALTRGVALERLTDYQEEGDLLAGDLNADFDRMWMGLQDTRAIVDSRAMRAPLGEAITDLPPLAMRKGLLLAFDAVTGHPIVAGPTAGSATALAVSLASTSPGAGLVGRSPSVVYTAGTVGAELTGVINAAALSGVDRSGVTDSTTALNNASLLCKRLYLPTGTYAVNALALRTDMEIFGDGDSTVIRPLTSATIFAAYFDSGSSNPANNISNLYIHDVQFRGWSDTTGLSQFLHLVALNGVSHALFERVTFRAPRGDCVYLGSGSVGGQERHNFGITFRKCHFDGVDHSNRNGISVIDCEGLSVEDCLFENLTHPTMPGAIDVEPNASWNVCRDIKVVHNRFKKTGGAAGWFAIQAGNLGMTTPITGILVAGNTVDSAGYTTDLEKGVFISIYGDADSTRFPLDCKISDNTFRSLAYPFRIDGVSDITFRDNRWETTVAEARVGATYKCLDVRIEDDYFYQLANDNTSGGNGVTIFTGSFVSLRRNRFVNCGKANGTQGYCIHFSTGTSDNVYIEQNIATGANTTHFIQASGTHTFTPATNLWSPNQVGSLPHSDFPARKGSTTYDPPSLLNNTGTTATLTCTGARLGDDVSWAFSQDLQNTRWRVYVSAADTVTFKIFNDTGGTIDLPSGTLSAQTAPPI